jgi:hypothetical protein
MRFLIAPFLSAALCFGLSTPALAQPGEAELTFWKTVQESADPAEYRAYLEAFPGGVFAPLARVRIKQLEGAGEAVAAPAALSTQGSPADAGEESEGRPGPATVENDIGYLGVEFAELTPAEARSAGLGAPLGVRIIRIVDDGPADRGGLKVNDVVLKAGGFPVATMQGFAEILKAKEPGAEVAFEIIRGGRKRTIEVTIGGFLADNLAAAGKGDTVAMRFLSDVYGSGRLGEPDAEAALMWLNKAVDAGDAGAMARLARYYWDGTLVQRDRKKAIDLYERAGDRGDAGALATLGDVYYEGQMRVRNLSTAFRYYRRAGEAGNAAVYHGLGQMYKDGSGTAKNVAEAARWYRKAAGNDNVDSIVSLAILLHVGDGVAQNHREAARLYQRVLDLGGDDGSRIFYNYSLLYAYGDGVAKDERKAVDLLYRAIRANDSFAIERFTTNPTSWSREFRRMLQTRLKQDGFYDGGIDGAFGPKSKEAIELAAKAGPVSAAAAAAATGGASTSAAAAGDLSLGRLEDFSTLD